MFKLREARFFDILNEQRDKGDESSWNTICHGFLKLRKRVTGGP